MITYWLRLVLFQIYLTSILIRLSYPHFIKVVIVKCKELFYIVFKAGLFSLFT
jgi:hypothetical protein